MENLDLVQRIAVWALPVLFAITVHEVAHGWAARLLGDPTAMMLGRLTLNPLKHVDPIGTVLLPGLLLYAGGFLFGWARPVPVTWENLHHPRRDMALVAAAGPAANLLMALGWTLMVRIAVATYGSATWFAEPLLYMGIAGIFINVILFALNLLPLLPLDGGRVLSGILPARLAAGYARLEPYGLIVLLALLALGLLGQVLSPVIFFATTLLGVLGGLPPSLTASLLEALGAL
jgi:Zn-dependent protease